MKNKKFFFYTLCLVFSFVLTGCAQVTTLTSEEEDQIAAYCAKTVAKFNKLKAQGVINLRHEEDTDDASEEADTSDIPQSIDAEVDLTGEAELVDSSEETEALLSGDSATLADVLGTSGLTFTFKNATEVGYYSMGGYYEITPAEGNDFLALTFDVTNTTDADVALDVPGTQTKFKAVASGASNTADNTILLNDLSNYSGTIAAGSSEELVLLFQFKPENLTDLSQVHLQSVQNNTITNIIL